jgi:hypothetical protein
MMKSRKMAALLAVAALICGCEAKIGTGDGNVVANGQSSAEGKAEEGSIALDAPGFNLKLKVPLDQAHTENDGKILYPGVTLTGLFVDAHPDTKAGSDGEVELLFSSPDSPDKVAAWYRDPGRAPNFSLSSDSKEGAAFLFTGTRRDDDGSFKLKLEPKGSGTDGRLAIRDKR